MKKYPDDASVVANRFYGVDQQLHLCNMLWTNQLVVGAGVDTSLISRAHILNLTQNVLL